MLLLDASVVIYAWDNYPVDKFPRLWDWLAQEIVQKKLRIPEIAFSEVERKYLDLANWLNSNSICKLSVSNDIINKAFKIKNEIGIVNDKYGSGVGENDILIIATAKIHNTNIMTDEARQPDLPKNRANYKMPAVCNLIGVETLNFIEYIKQSNQVF